jgi:hypothetical protein
MSGHKQFGSMRVGTIVDGLALPEHAPRVIAAAARCLEARGADVIVSNQAHAAWCSALKRAAFMRGPSNYVFAVSRQLAQRLHPFEVNQHKIHLNRGDGAGPIHL